MAVPDKTWEILDRWFWVGASFVFVLIATVLVAVEVPMFVNSEVEPLIKPQDVHAKILEFKPVALTGNWTGIPSGDVLALHYLRRAGEHINNLFLNQVCKENDDIRNELVSQQYKYRREFEINGVNEDQYNFFSDLIDYFDINYGPWAVLEDYDPFLGPTSRFKMPKKFPETAEYYPHKLKEDDWNKYLQILQDEGKTDEYECAMSTYSVLYSPAKKANSTGIPNIACKWYSEAYADWLEPISTEVMTAAKYVTDEPTRVFLETLVESFSNNKYMESDTKWLDIPPESLIDVTIGPYEVYMDRFGTRKAAWEIFLGITHQEETKRVGVYSYYLPTLEKNLPSTIYVPRDLVVEESTVKVIYLMYSAGEARQGSQTLAYNLPNNLPPNRTSKQVMLFNTQEAKYNLITLHIADLVLDVPQGLGHDATSFYANFQHTISHEFAHALGPRETKDHKEIETELLPYYNSIEEAKADIGALWSINYLSTRMDPSLGRALPCSSEQIPNGPEENYMECNDFVEQAFVTFTASAFRSFRFGFSEAHGLAAICYFNRLMDEGAIISYDHGDGTYGFWIDTEAMKVAVGTIFAELIDMEYLGDGEAAALWIENNQKVRTEIQWALDQINADRGDDTIPVDIRPIFDEF